MSTQSNVTVVLGFADSSEKSIEDVPDEAVGDIRDIVLAINLNANGEYNPFYQTFLSNGGASFSSITAAKLVSVEEEVVYNGQYYKLGSFYKDCR